MKTLMILLVILGVIFLYFVINAEKSITIGKNGEIIPVGIDIPRFIFNKAKETLPKLINSGDVQIPEPDSIKNIAENVKYKIKDLTIQALNKITDSIKAPIENKINEVLCPVK